MSLTAPLSPAPNIHPFAPSSSPPPITPPPPPPVLPTGVDEGTGVFGRGAVEYLTGLGETGGESGSTTVLVTAERPVSVRSPFVDALGVVVSACFAAVASEMEGGEVAEGTVTKLDSPEEGTAVSWESGKGEGRPDGDASGLDATGFLSFDEGLTIPRSPFELFLLRLGFRRMDPSSKGDDETFEGAATDERSMEGVWTHSKPPFT